MKRKKIILMLSFLLMLSSFPFNAFASPPDLGRRDTNTIASTEVSNKSKEESPRVPITAAKTSSTSDGNGGWNDESNSDDKSLRKLPPNVGLKPDGSNDYINIPKEYDYIGLRMIAFNWAGLTYDPATGGGFDKNGNLQMLPPDTRYDVLIEMPYDPKEKEKNPDVDVSTLKPVAKVYSGFGFGGESKYSKYTKAPIVERVDVSDKFNKLWIDVGWQTGDSKNLVNAEPMDTIPLNSKITMIDYSVPGKPSANIITRDMQVYYYTPENIQKILNKQSPEGSTLYVRQTHNTDNFTFTLDETKAVAGTQIFTFENARDDQKLYDKESKTLTEYANNSMDTNYRTLVTYDGVKTGNGTRTKLKEWHFEAYKFVVEESPKVPLFKITKIDFPTLPTPNPDPKNPEKPNIPDIPDKPVIVPPNTTIPVEITVEPEEPTKDPDKTNDKPTDPTDPTNKDKNRKPNNPVPVDVNPAIDIETTDKDGNKTDVTIKDGVDPEVKKPGKKKLKHEIKTGKPGEEQIVCVSINGSTYNKKTSELTAEEKDRKCIKIKVQATDLEVNGAGTKVTI